MASREAIAISHQEAITELTAILERHDPDLGDRAANANHGRGIPSPTRSPGETAAYHAECMASLARLVDRQLTPRKRGRPPKTQ